jgi:Lectin C-type domain
MKTSGAIFATVIMATSFTTRAAIFLNSGAIVNPANGHSYYLLTTGNWTDSEAFAQTLGGHLATINDAAEDNWVYTTFSNFAGTPRSVWIGFNDAAVEGSFVWASGEPVSYTNWYPGEPNNNLNLEDYTYIENPGVPGLDSKWNDYQNLSTIPGQPNAFGLVEVVPEPSSLAMLLLAGGFVIRRGRN